MTNDRQLDGLLAHHERKESSGTNNRDVESRFTRAELSPIFLESFSRRVT